MEPSFPLQEPLDVNLPVDRSQNEPVPFKA